MKKVLCMLLTAILALSCVSALADDTIKIGGIAPLTGAVSVYGNLVKNGVDLYVAEVNANGGVLGKQVEMVVADDQGGGLYLLRFHFVDQALGQELYIGLGEIIADDGAESAGSELNHFEQLL